jgi:putative heme iron utilization protein
MKTGTEEQGAMDEKKDVLRRTDAEAIRLAKTLLRCARYGALAVLDPETGAPSASRVGVATDMDGAPVILVSALAAHTRGLLADPRCSLLLGEPGKGDPLVHPRISLACRAVKLERGTPDHLRVGRRYLNRNPKAKLYADLGDFSFFRLELQGASLNGGFGKAYLLERADLVISGPVNDDLAQAEQSALDHMNKDHRDAIDLYASVYAARKGEDWLMSGLDADGIDLSRGSETARVFFPQPLSEAAQIRSALVEMARAGRDVKATRR